MRSLCQAHLHHLHMQVFYTIKKLIVWPVRMRGKAECLLSMGDLVFSLSLNAEILWIYWYVKLWWPSYIFSTDKDLNTYIYIKTALSANFIRGLLLMVLFWCQHTCILHNLPPTTQIPKPFNISFTLHCILYKFLTHPPLISLHSKTSSALIMISYPIFIDLVFYTHLWTYSQSRLVD